MSEKSLSYIYIIYAIYVGYIILNKITHVLCVHSLYLYAFVQMKHFTSSLSADVSVLLDI